MKMYEFQLYDRDIIEMAAQDVAGAMGMKAEGAEVLLGGLVKKGSVIDVSFKSDKIKKYIKAKAEQVMGK